MNDLEREVDRLDQTDNAWEDTDEVVEVEVKRPLDTVVPVRLSSEVWAEMYRVARDIGVGPSTLARMWIMEKLRETRRERRSA